MAPRVARSARVLALVAASTVVGVWLLSLFFAQPDASTEWLSRIFVLAAALAAPLFLLLVASGIDDLSELPQRYPKVGAEVRSRVVDLDAQGTERVAGSSGR